MDCRLFYNTISYQFVAFFDLYFDIPLVMRSCIFLRGMVITPLPEGDNTNFLYDRI